jgi:WD40 repeat protein
VALTCALGLSLAVPVGGYCLLLPDRCIAHLSPRATLWDWQFSPDGRFLAAAEFGKMRGGDNVRVWDARSWQLLRVLEAAGPPVRFSGDGTKLLTGGGRRGGPRPSGVLPDDRLRLWDTRRWTCRRLPSLPPGRDPRQCCPVLTPEGDGTALVSDGPAPSVWLGDTGLQPRWRKLTDGSALVGSSGDGSLLLVSCSPGPGADADLPLKLVERSSGRTVRAFGARVVAMSRRGGFIALGNGSREIEVRRLRDWELVQRIDYGTAAASVSLSGDGQLLAVSSPGSPVQLFDVGSGEQIMSFPGPGGRALGVQGQLSPDGTLLAVESDGSLDVWSVPPASALLTRARLRRILHLPAR